MQGVFVGCDVKCGTVTLSERRARTMGHIDPVRGCRARGPRTTWLGWIRVLDRKGRCGLWRRVRELTGAKAALVHRRFTLL
jgi:hypothetical protein